MWNYFPVVVQSPLNSVITGWEAMSMNGMVKIWKTREHVGDYVLERGSEFKDGEFYGYYVELHDSAGWLLQGYAGPEEHRVYVHDAKILRQVANRLLADTRISLKPEYVQ